ncbi:NUDIX hydrolase [Streptomyces sp. NBRC 110611]|uniref:NUDIX hydrolase n=1 Tax=Streptomyces sp. NBRC 110611 TaxID=1621259 RepID=UPI00099FDAA1|nr:NUDIX hydrolase [Streptomyces sp. NBRC 110611]
MNQPAAHKYLAAAVVVHNGRVLIVRRSYRERFLPGTWGVPCGKLDPGESAESGALRELKEETGLLGAIVAHTGSSGFLSDYRGRHVHNHQRNFLVRPLTFDVVLPSPDQVHRWARPSELAGAGVDAYNLEVIRQALGGRFDAAGRHVLAARIGGPGPVPVSSPKSVPARRVRQDRRPVAAEPWAAAGHAGTRHF